MFLVITTPPPVAAATPVAPTVRRIVAPQVRVAKQGIPTRVQIPSLAIDLPVGVGTYDEASSDWLVDGTQAYYAAASVPSNDNNGNNLIYDTDLDITWYNPNIGNMTWDQANIWITTLSFSFIAYSLEAERQHASIRP